METWQRKVAADLGSLNEPNGAQPEGLDMSADISQLNLKEPDPVDWADYAPASSGPQAPPPAGTYTVVAPDKFSYGANAEGRLVVTVDPLKIVGPTNVDKVVRFTRVSSKKYSNRNASPVGDYLRAHGIQLQGNPSNQDIADAVEQTAGRPFTIDLDWEGYDKEAGETVYRTMDEFPDDGKGGKQFIVKTPTGGTVRANARVKRYRPLA
jgi:hypothetical protein